MRSTLLTALGIGFLMALPQAAIGQEPPPEKEKQKQEDPKKQPPPPKKEPERPKPEEPKREPAPQPNRKPEEREKQDEKAREKQQENERKSADKRQERERREDQDRRSQAAKRENRQSAHSGRGQHIPPERFQAHFGREHHFRVGHIDNGRRFVREGVTFELVEVWPAAWSYDDDFFIEDDGDDYYLVDVIHPEIRVLVIVI